MTNRLFIVVSRINLLFILLILYIPAGIEPAGIYKKFRGFKNRREGLGLNLRKFIIPDNSQIIN